jgi:hypothetical protein
MDYKSMSNHFLITIKSDNGVVSYLGANGIWTTHRAIARVYHAQSFKDVTEDAAMWRFTLIHFKTGEVLYDPYAA